MSETNFKSPKCFSKQKQSHKNLYKTSPNWPQVYKRKCLSELNQKRNESRIRLSDRFRNIQITEKTTNSSDENDYKMSELGAFVDQTMLSVWNTFNNEYKVNISDISDYMEDIRKELLMEECQYWENMVDSYHKQELEWLCFQRDSIVCFFCQKNPAQIRPLENGNKTELSCLGCDFIHTFQFAFTSSYIQQRVDLIVDNHQKICSKGWIHFKLFYDNSKRTASDGAPNEILAFCNYCLTNVLIFKELEELTANICYHKDCKSGDA